LIKDSLSGQGIVEEAAARGMDARPFRAGGLRSRADRRRERPRGRRRHRSAHRLRDLQPHCSCRSGAGGFSAAAVGLNPDLFARPGIAPMCGRCRRSRRASRCRRPARMPALLGAVSLASEPGPPTRSSPRHHSPRPPRNGGRITLNHPARGHHETANSPRYPRPSALRPC